MKIRDKLYAIKEEAITAAKKPIIEKRVNRALDGVIDEYESMKIDSQEKIDNLLRELVNGNISVIRDLTKELLRSEELDALKAKTEWLKGYLDSESAE